MVRRLSVASRDCGAESPVYGGEPSASAGRDPGGKPPWAVPPMHSVPLSVLQFYETPSSGNGAGNDTTGTAAPGFPVMLGEAFSMRFGPVYLNYSPSAAAPLAAFIPEDVWDRDPQFDWNGNGISVTQSTEVAGIDVRSAGTAAAALTAGVNGPPMELGGPRCASDGDQVALGRYLAPEASISGLGGAVRFDGIISLQVPRGGTARDTPVTADRTITDQVGPGSPTLVTSYDMSVIDQQSGRWYVKDIRASTQPMGTS
jgi:hypothetical protein